MIETLLLALALAGQAAPAAPAAPEPVAVTPAQFAQAIQGVVGQTYEGGVSISHIYAEGQIVVIVLDGPAGWRTPAVSGPSWAVARSRCATSRPCAASAVARVWSSASAENMTTATFDRGGSPRTKRRTSSPPTHGMGQSRMWLSGVG